MGWCSTPLTGAVRRSPKRAGGCSRWTRVTVESRERLGTARNRGLDEELLRTQFGRLGNTPYELAGLAVNVEGAPFAPSSLLNALRRDAVEKLQAAQETRAAISRPLPE